MSRDSELQRKMPNDECEGAHIKRQSQADRSHQCGAVKDKREVVNDVKHIRRKVAGSNPEEYNQRQDLLKSGDVDSSMGKRSSKAKSRMVWQRSNRTSKQTPKPKYAVAYVGKGRDQQLRNTQVRGDH